MATDTSKSIPLDMKIWSNSSTVTAGEGRRSSDCLLLLVVESFLPKGIWIRGPPEKSTDSLAANTIISAQDTCPGHSASSTDFIYPIASCFLIPKFFEENNSELPESSKIDASHPCIKETFRNFQVLHAYRKWEDSHARTIYLT